MEEDLTVAKPESPVRHGILVADLPPLLVAPVRGQTLKWEEI